MESDADSEYDRRAYGQYTSLAAEGDSDIDEEAASYLRSVREEAKAIPDVMISAHEGRPEEQQDQAVPLEDEGGEATQTDIQASPDWIKQFMHDFLQLRLALQSLDLEDGEVEEAKNVEKNLLQGTQVEERPQESSMQMEADSEQSLLGMSAAHRLEEEVDRICSLSQISAEDVYSIYGLSAVLDHPLMASTEASMTQLLRHCSSLRKTSKGSEITHAYLDILETLAGAYFGQDLVLREQYREYGLHT